jgi:hypothetical protein
MKLLNQILFGIIIAAISWIILCQKETKSVEPLVEKPVQKLTNRQEIYLAALEWCESYGNPDAINPHDSDGKPSYGAFQFRPSTLKWLAIKYEILTEKDLDTDQKVMEKVMDRDIQRSIVTEMILDNKIQFSKQFPHCVNHKIGQPPRQ